MTENSDHRPSHENRSVLPTRPAAVTSQDGTTIGYQTLGAGYPVILIGGALRAGDDYLPFARLLARTFTVHVMDRRGRGASGPQGVAYSIESECQDVLAVQHKTRARMVFGHSYGGLVALETARRTSVFARIAVYEPGVSVAGSMPVAWVDRYRDLLSAGDPHGAFTVMARGAGHAPTLLTRAPFGLVRALISCMPKRQWRQLEPLLTATLAENEEIARLDAADAQRFSSVTARVLLLGGTKSPSAITTPGLTALHDALHGSEMRMLPGLQHTAPESKTPKELADVVTRFLRSGISGDEAVRPEPTNGTVINDMGKP